MFVLGQRIHVGSGVDQYVDNVDTVALGGEMQRCATNVVGCVGVRAQGQLALGVFEAESVADPEVFGRVRWVFQSRCVVEPTGSRMTA